MTTVWYKATSQKERRQKGFTLLEILLTTAILLVGVTAVLHSTRTALRSMSESKELTEAQNACQAVLNELLAQSAPIQPDTSRIVDHLPLWKIRVDIYPATQTELYVLHLSAQQYLPDGTLLGTKYQLLRWVPAERVNVSSPTEMLMGNEFESVF